MSTLKFQDIFKMKKSATRFFSLTIKLIFKRILIYFIRSNFKHLKRKYSNLFIELKDLITKFKLLKKVITFIILIKEC